MKINFFFSYIPTELCPSGRALQKVELYVQFNPKATLSFGQNTHIILSVTHFLNLRFLIRTTTFEFAPNPSRVASGFTQRLIEQPPFLGLKQWMQQPQGTNFASVHSREQGQQHKATILISQP